MQHLCRGNKNTEILKVNRSEGVVTRSPAFRKSTRTLRCKEYFYGPQNNLLPHAQTLRFSELRFFKIGGSARAPSSALPIGEPHSHCCLVKLFMQADVTIGFTSMIGLYLSPEKLWSMVLFWLVPILGWNEAPQNLTCLQWKAE